eukprot:s2045_g1.t1
MVSVIGPKRLRELSRQTKNLAQRCRAAAAASAPAEVEGAADGGRCAPDSLMCMLVCISVVTAPTRQLTSLLAEEQLAGSNGLTFACHVGSCGFGIGKMVGQRDVYCAAKYVLEHRLMAYVEVQNTEHGVALSRAQMVDVALTSIPATAPLCVKERLGVLVQGTQGMGTCAQKIALTLRNAARRPAGIGSLLARSLV